MSLDPNEELTFFNPRAEIKKSGDQLPHWQQSGATYFITFRLADSVPAELHDALEEQRTAWVAHHPKPWGKATTTEFHQRFSGALERWLDAGHGSCALRDGGPREIVAQALRHFDGTRYSIHSAVVMPNHVHVLASIHPSYFLERILHSWKSFTAHEILRCNPSATNPFWQADYFDRLIRDAGHFRNCVRYIRANPRKATLGEDEFTLIESELARDVV